MTECVDDWRRYPAAGLSNDEAALLRRYERTRRPLDGSAFLRQLGRVLRQKTRGLRPKNKQKYPYSIRMKDSAKKLRRMQNVLGVA